MRQILLSLVSTAFVLSAVSLGACSSDSTPSPAAPASTTPGSVDTTSGGSTTPDAGPPGTTADAAPPEPEWVAPVVATSSAACNGAGMPDAKGAPYTTPGGRTYHVFTPTNYDASKTYPVVFAFHGWQTEGMPFESWFKMEESVNGEAFVVYPDAVGGYWDLNGTTDLVFFDEMVKQIGETYCIDPSHILGFGFSYGAYFMNTLGCARAGYVKAIVMGEGGFVNAPTCGRLPVFVTSRTNDTEEPPSHGKPGADAWSTRDRCTPGATQQGDAAYNCTSYTGCKLPGSVTYCEDTSSLADNPRYDPSWDHTVTPRYQAYGYQWFKALP